MNASLVDCREVSTTAMGKLGVWASVIIRVWDSGERKKIASHTHQMTHQLVLSIAQPAECTRAPMKWMKVQMQHVILALASCPAPSQQTTRHIHGRRPPGWCALAVLSVKVCWGGHPDLERFLTGDLCHCALSHSHMTRVLAIWLCAHTFLIFLKHFGPGRLLASSSSARPCQPRFQVRLPPWRR